MDIFKNKDLGRFCFFNESKNINIESTPETTPSLFIKRDDLQKPNELPSSQKQVKGLRLQDKLRKQNFHEDMKRVFGPVTDKMKEASKKVTNTMMGTSEESSKAVTDPNE